MIDRFLQKTKGTVCLHSEGLAFLIVLHTMALFIGVGVDVLEKDPSVRWFLPTLVVLFGEAVVAVLLLVGWLVSTVMVKLTHTLEKWETK